VACFIQRCSELSGAGLLWWWCLQCSPGYTFGNTGRTRVIISITLLSVVLTGIRARTGRLLPCFVIHFVFNGIQSLIIVFEPYLRALVEHWRPQPTPGLLIHILHFLG